VTKLILETDNNWAKGKIRDIIFTETELLKKVIQKIQGKLKKFENMYGKFDRESLYGKVDDMELLEWEGEIETMAKLKKNLTSFEEIIFEYK